MDLPAPRALLWDKTSTPIDLGFGAGTATDGTRQVGTGFPPFSGSHAMLWSGTVASAIDLGNYTVGTSLGGGEQVGYSQFPDHAALWRGMAGSLVDLNPVGYSESFAFGTDGTHQVGQGTTKDGDTHALLWSGTAASAVDLNPSEFQFVDTSTATGVAGAQQVGYVTFRGPIAPLHAVLWTGSGSSAVDLHPTAKGWLSSWANDTNGVQQVGAGLVASTGPTRAVVWSGTAESAVDLQALLPAPYSQSFASSIDRAGDVFGIAADSAGNYYAVEWAVPEPSSFALLALAVAGMLHRWR